MTEAEHRAVMKPLLRAAAMAARIEKRLTISEQVGWPVDVSHDLAVARGLLAHARAEYTTAQARQRFQRRHGR